MLSTLLLITTLIGGGQVMDRKTSEKGIEIIKRHEKEMDNVYVCPGGILTGGWGHALSREEKKIYKLGSAVDPGVIHQWFAEDLSKAEKTVNNWVTKEIGQNQFDALVSFVFNVGADAFKRSTLLKMINKEQFELASKEFPKWVNSKGRKLPGLVKRRNEEMELFKKAEVAEALVT
jgi:lysozyme